MTLPPGFRFKPTDEELVSYYLRKRVEGSPIEFRVIADVDLYRCEPWDLPHQSLIPSSNDLEWFFFSPRDRKYPNGTRTNRATEYGYWKATGRDRTVKSRGKEIGMKKTLVFYMGRAPNGNRTDWLMHEYRLQESGPSDDLDAYVLCRVFKKTGVTTLSDGPENPVEMMDEGKYPPDNSPQHVKPEPPEETPALPMNGLESTYMQYPPLITQSGQSTPGSLATQLLGNEELPSAIFDMKFDRSGSASDLEGLMRLLEEDSPPCSGDFLAGHGLSLPGDGNAAGRNEGGESKQSGEEGEQITWNPWDNADDLYMHNTPRALPPLTESPSPPPSSAPVPVPFSIDARDKTFGPVPVPSSVRVGSRLPAGAAAHADGPFPAPARQMVKFQIRSPPKKEQKTDIQDTPESVKSEPSRVAAQREMNHDESSEETVNNGKDAEEILSRRSDTNTPPILSTQTETSPATVLDGPPPDKTEGNENKNDLPESDVDDAEKEGLATGGERQQVPVKTATATTMTRQQQEQRRLNLENRMVMPIARVLGSLLFQGKSSSVVFPCGVGSICVKAVPIKCSCEKGHDGQEPRDCECYENAKPANVVASSCAVEAKVYPETTKLVDGEEQQSQPEQRRHIQHGEGKALQKTSAGSTKQFVGVFLMGVASAFLGLFVFPSAWRATCQA